MKRSDVDLKCINKCCIVINRHSIDQSNVMPLFVKRKLVIFSFSFSLDTQVKRATLFSSESSNETNIKMNNDGLLVWLGFLAASSLWTLDSFLYLFVNQKTRTEHFVAKEQRSEHSTTKTIKIKEKNSYVNERTQLS